MNNTSCFPSSSTPHTYVHILPPQAIATTSHGSSMRYGSMSSLVRSAKVVLANGTIATIDGSRPDHLAAVRFVYVICIDWMANHPSAWSAQSKQTLLYFYQIQPGPAGRGGGADAGGGEEHHGPPQLDAARPVGAP